MRHDFPLFAVNDCACPALCHCITQKGENAMNWDVIKGNWKKTKGYAQQQWGKLTNDDLDQIEGNRDILVGKLQERYGYGKDEANREVNDWTSRTSSGL
jgi:uncharacterized protein YjbJ (UPF0337 family)